MSKVSDAASRDASAAECASYSCAGPKPKQRPRILLVEDDEAVRELLATILDREGFPLLQTGCSPEALGLLEASGDPIGLLVTDVVMPDLSGPQLVARIRRRQPDLPVLFVTGHTEDSANFGADVGGRWAVLTKPFPSQDLVDAVERLLGAVPDDA